MSQLTYQNISSYVDINTDNLSTLITSDDISFDQGTDSDATHVFVTNEGNIRFVNKTNLAKVLIDLEESCFQHALNNLKENPPVKTESDFTSFNYIEKQSESNLFLNQLKQKNNSFYNILKIEDFQKYLNEIKDKNKIISDYSLKQPLANAYFHGVLYPTIRLQPKEENFYYNTHNKPIEIIVEATQGFDLKLYTEDGFWVGKRLEKTLSTTSINWRIIDNIDDIYNDLGKEVQKKLFEIVNEINLNILSYNFQKTLDIKNFKKYDDLTIIGFIENEFITWEYIIERYVQVKKPGDNENNSHPKWKPVLFFR